MRFLKFSLAMALCGSFAFPVTAVSAAKFDTGNELYATCTGTVDNEIQCLAFLEGYHTGVTVAALELGRLASIPAERLQLYCMPQGVTLGQSKDVVVNFLRDHAQVRHLPANALVLNALELAFPCRLRSNK
jgi:hypothetical protein